uniref:Sulfotransferase n=1 Tax=Planktothricoides sp. SpSt-374 TaxID=2282167 RepID=A0A7C3VSA1_9CYAN
MNKSQIFILGCERSGSTWLSNILDAHPDIEFFMEPFADYVDLFPGFPNRNIYFDSGNAGNDEIINMVNNGYKSLTYWKYLFFYKPGGNTDFKKFDHLISNTYSAILRKLQLKLPLWLLKYQLLNLNTLYLPPNIKPKDKNYILTIEVTKELRLNFKINLLARIFPNAQYIVVIRHPGAQISSIKKLFHRKHLGELNRYLCSFIDDILECSIFKEYWNTAQLIQTDNNLDKKLALWWLINYNVLLSNLKFNQLNYHLIKHEELSYDPTQTIYSLFKKINLSYHKNVESYLEESSNKSSLTSSPVNTTRDSKTYYIQCIKDIDPKLNQIIEEIIANQNHITPLDADLSNYLRQFYTF